jgi:fructokinase
MDRTKPANERRPVIFGEVLFDVFEDGREILGGAPFNVAWHLRGFGLAPLLISRIGEDRRGAAVLTAMKRWGLDTRGIQIDPERPTGLVRAVIRDGHPSFDIQPEQTYDFIDGEEAVAAVADQNPALLYHGTLALRHSVSLGALQGVRSRFQSDVLFDVNLRAPWWKLGEAVSHLDQATWVKMNEDELAVFAGTVQEGADMATAARELVGRHGLTALIVTLGERGARWYDRAGHVETADAAPVAELVDTVGAGDAFTAVVILGLLQGWIASDLLRRATNFAAEICRRQGATAPEPTLYESVQRGWEHDGKAGNRR